MAGVKIARSRYCYTGPILALCNRRFGALDRASRLRQTTVNRPSSKPVRSTAPPAVHRQARRAVRIIGGNWKRTSLPVVDGPGVRPTPDRVRETVFNWLIHLFGGSLTGLSVLDCCAGSGALGFEAASRGAARVLLVENQAQVVAGLRAVKDKLGAQAIEIRQSDIRSVLSDLVQRADHFDLIFLDPPYGEGWLTRLLPDARTLVAPGGCVYVEAEAPLDQILAADATLQASFEVLRADKAGQVFYYLLRRKN